MRRVMIVVNDRLQPQTTPAEIKVSRRRRVTVRFELDGFEPAAYQVKRRGSAWLLANLLLALNPLAAQGASSGGEAAKNGALLLAHLTGIDLLTGAAFALPKSVDVTLVPVATERTESPPAAAAPVVHAHGPGGPDGGQVR